MDNIKQKKTSFCTNCSKLNHEYKECRDPVTSYGIILINFKNQLVNFNKDFINLIKSGNKFEIDEYGIKVNSYKDIEKVTALDKQSYINNAKTTFDDSEKITQDDVSKLSTEDRKRYEDAAKSHPEPIKPKI